MKELKQRGYLVRWSILSSRRYVPRTRRQSYLVGIKSENLRSRANQIPIFPEPPVNLSPSLRSLIIPLPANLWAPHPPKSDTTKYNNVIAAHKEISDTVNPFRKPCIVDAGATTKFSSVRIEECQTLTRTRVAQHNGYWCSTKGGGLDPTGMAAMEGFEPQSFRGRS